MWQRVAPFVMALYTGALVGFTIALPEVRDALFEEMPISLVLLGRGAISAH